MKRHVLGILMAAAALTVFATGCVTSTGDEFIAEANEFLEGAEKYKTHENQKDELPNLFLNMTQQHYLNTGGALADIIRIRFGEADILLLRQNVENDDNYIKKWEVLRFEGRDEKSTKAAQQAKKELIAAIKENITANKLITKRTPEQIFEIIATKRALADYIERAHKLKEAGKDAAAKAEVNKAYAGMDAWMAKGKQELTSCFTDEYKKAEAKRAQLIKESEERNQAELEKIKNKAKYIGLIAAMFAGQITASQTSGIAQQIALRAAAAAAAEKAEMEKKYPYVTELFDRFNSCPTLADKAALAKDLAAQYGYAGKIGGLRLAYTFRAIPWYFASKDALDDATGE